MEWLNIFIIGLLWPRVIDGISYSAIYNFNNHSYYFSSKTQPLKTYSLKCESDNNYPVYVENEAENNVLASVLRHDSAIGIHRGRRGSSDFLSYHTNKKITYSNWDVGRLSRYRTIVLMKSNNGRWKVYSQFRNQYIICENDKLASNGINITADKLINFKNDYLLTYRGHSYYVYHVSRDFETIRKICKNDHDGYVFIPNDGSENCALHETFANFAYLGITLRKNIFITDKGYQATYLPWLPNNPTTRECVVRGITGSFTSSSCSSAKHIICETDSVVTGANITTCNSTNKKHYFSQTLYFNNYGFYVFNIKTNHKEALKLCEERGETLFLAQNKQENCAVMENIFDSPELNYGQIYVKYVFTRGDGIISNYTNWDTGFPKDITNKPCVFAQFSSGKWINGACKNSTFVCRRKAPRAASNINCSQSYKEDLSTSYSFKYDSNTYTMFGYRLSYHDSVRLCSYYNQALVQTTNTNAIDQIRDILINVNFYMDYRIMWTDAGKLAWFGDAPKNTPNWSPGEPKMADFQISCVSVMPNGTWTTNLCSDKNIAVCKGNAVPTTPTTPSTIGSTTSTASTTTTTTTTAPETTTASTTASTTHSTASSYVAASKHKSSVGIGVGVFFGVLAILGVVLGVFIYRKKKGMPLNILSSFGSFRKRRSFTMDS